QVLADAKRELAEQKNVTGLLYIDNYEEVIKSIEVEHQGLLSALVEQKIQRYFQSYGAIVAATQKDHFFISVNAKGLQRMMEDRFSLLEDVKTVRAGNDTPVTASIAFCRIHDSYEENLEETRKAIDLALGRGGDQAVVRTEAGVEYFGGKSIGEGTQTRVKARVKAQALRELMASSDQIFAMGHKNGDNDSLGACVAIYRAAASMNKKVSIVLNDVSFSMKPLLDRFKASDAYPSDMFLTGKQALSQIRDNALVVVVDTNQPSMTECPEILEQARSVVVFDHHRQMAEAIQATLSYVEPYASSACELTTEILQYFGEGVRPRPVEAEAIYAGIVVDTNNFIDRTGVRTFDAASYLKRSGVDLTRVRKLLREDYRSYIVKAETAREAELVLDNYAFSECKAEGLDSPKVVGAQAANELLNIEGVKASFVFTQVKNTVYISARSIDELNVQLVMERIGGGGHLSMAGAQLENTTVAEARTLVKNTLEGMLKEGAL
ncbi:MAG: DHH family phosphoesterase, partial [Firmicutes bacterium]|nr:DHH family phosphoesterase [Bacillota bacterium]